MDKIPGQEVKMEKILELIDAMMKSQKEFIENWLRSQKEFMEQWTESTKKMQESFLSLGGTQEGPAKDMFAMYRTWTTTMWDSSKVFTDEAGRVQETWKNTIEKQMDMGREMVKNLSALLGQAAGKK